MTARRFDVTRLDELPSYAGEITTIPVRLPLGIGSFGVNVYGPGASGQVIEEHDELGAGAGRHEELYIILAGHAVFTLDGEEVEAPAGTLVFVRDPAVRRRAHARGAETRVLVVGGTPGQPFRPSPWESWLEALPHYEAKDYVGAVEVLTRALEAHPDNPNVLYNLACCESLAGEHERALEHVLRAAELDERVPTWAQSDNDLDPVRNDPRFPS